MKVPPFLLFGIDYHSLSNSALSPPSSLEPTELANYCEELMLSLSATWKLATSQIRKVQAKYKKYHDKKTKLSALKVGDWVLVKFSREAMDGKIIKTLAWTLSSCVLGRP